MSLEFDGRAATFTQPGIAVCIDAHGDWPGRATFPAYPLMAFVKIPPTSKNIEVKTDTKSITIAGIKVRCDWSPSAIDNIDDYLCLPEPATDLQMLKMLSITYEKYLQKEGLDMALSKTIAYRDRQISKALDRLSYIGVTDEDLLNIINKVIISKN